MISARSVLAGASRTAAGFINVYRGNLKFRVGISLLVAIIAFGLVGLMAPPGYKEWYRLPKDLPPQLGSDPTYLLGTTSNGRSVFWSITNGILNSLIISFITALIAPHIGLLVGMAAGLRGGFLDRALMFITDTVIVIPALPLYIVLAMFLKNFLNMYLLGLIISISSWPWPARQVRAIMLSLRERDFMITARLSGMKMYKVLLTEAMPYLWGWHLINFSNTVLFAIGSEAGLAILGLSILQEDTLGVIIYWALNYGALYRGIVWWIVPPLVILVMLFVALYLVSVGLAEYVSMRQGRR